MAASGVMADFAKLPAQKKAMVFVGIAALLGVLYWHFLWKPLKADLAQAEKDNASKAALNKKLADDIPKYDELKANMKTLTAVIQENQKALPTEAEVPAFFETLERKVRESGVEILKWKKLKEAPIETFVRVPVEIEISGTFMQIKRFFASLVQKGVNQAVEGQVEERERVVSIENLALTTPTVRNREIVLKAKFVAVTFRQEDQAESKPTKPVKGAAPAARPTTPAPAATTPSTPPLPSSTPAGAKAQAESAIDKGDEINRNATGVDEAKTPGDGSARLKGGI